MQVVDIVLGVTSFFTIALGGLCVGMLLGLVTALITRFTKEVRRGVDISTYLHIYHHIYSGAGGGAPGHPLPGFHVLGFDTIFIVFRLLFDNQADLRKKIPVFNLAFLWPLLLGSRC